MSVNYYKNSNDAYHLKKNIKVDYIFTYSHKRCHYSQQLQQKEKADNSNLTEKKFQNFTHEKTFFLI